MKKLLLICVLLGFACVVSAQSSNANIGGVNFGSGAATPASCKAPSYFTNTTTQTYNVCVSGAYVSLGSSASLTFPLQGPNGGAGTPTYSFSTSPTTGFTLVSNNTPGVTTSGSFRSAWTATQLQNISTVCFSWSSTGTAAGTADTGICRNAAGIVAFGTSSSPVGTDTTGKLKASAYMSVGTKFASNAGCTEGTLVGGATAGKFTIGTGGSCTVVVTMGDVDTSPNGWACQVSDMTTSADAYNVHESASNATTATFVVGTAISSDVIQFSCIGY